jgi:hypothetical protein
MAVVHFTVTVGSSTLTIIHTLKMSVILHLPAVEWYSLIFMINVASVHLLNYIF